ncbi:DUF4394 domain-containing protein [Desertivirga brevis]|uniref:DUF4394 domain-containing protein n=1 Tax=Desertivirga brevis TaxID=2810310 RepID=UPI001A974CB9|nr:DUF4394 domain-containing protein [Pedobacter sp. SYSU D00873]
MRTTFTTRTAALFVLLLATTLFSCKKDNSDPLADKPDLMFTALTSTGTLQSYNANNLGMMPNSINITGLQSGETLLAIDYRPATGQLYGLGSTSRIYTISSSGKATAIGAGPFTPALSGSVAGFDFNPTVDRIRIVTTSGQNLRAHPETGAVAVVDGNINGVAGASISSVAYTNSKAGAASTVLFDIDVTAKKLYKQDPPNAGTLVEVGSLSFTGSATESSFDISPSGIALASVGNGSTSALYQINVENGTTVSLGNFPNTIVGIAIPTEPVAYAVDESNNLMIFNPEKADIITKAITGMQAGETIHGIDFRPVNGQLYALGSTSRIYTINLSSGAAAQVGMSPLVTLLSGTSFGFDFNPVVDRIRVISNTGQNLRLDPNTGLIAAVDGSLNPGSPSVSAGAYTNNFPGTTTTTLFDIDSGNDKLYKQDPPNAGGLVEVGSLGVDAQAANGFDIGGTSGMAYAVLTVGGATRLYTINTTTGMATVKSGVSFNSPVRGFAMGLGF